MAPNGKETMAIAAQERGPGPGRYALPSTCGFIDHDPTKRKHPAYSFGSRVEGGKIKDLSPGPVYFVNPVITRHGRDGTPIYSLLGRQKELAQFRTPAPGAYHPEKMHPHPERYAPRYSMGERIRYRKRDANPAPNRYSLPPLIGSSQPNTENSPSYTMKARRTAGSFADDLAKTPSPGQYNAIVPNAIKLQAPVYSLQGRSYMPGDNTRKPGPGAHSPEKVRINRPSQPSYSLGIRHSEFVTPLLP